MSSVHDMSDEEYHDGIFGKDEYVYYALEKDGKYLASSYDSDGDYNEIWVDDFNPDCIYWYESVAKSHAKEYKATIKRVVVAIKDIE